MGLDAYVQCNCIKEGKVKPPPFDITNIVCKDNVWTLTENADDQTFSDYIEWEENACDHPNFHYIYDRISNTSGSNVLSSALKYIGNDHFPILTSLWGKPQIPSELSKKAFQELEFLKNKIPNLKGNFLLDFETGEEYCKVFEGEERWFYSHGGRYYYILSDNGFYITGSENNKQFMSKKFVQRVETIASDNDVEFKVDFEDIATGRIHKTNKPIMRCINWNERKFYFPKIIYTINRNLDVRDFSSLKVLKNLFQASIITGNPVVLD